MFREAIQKASTYTRAIHTIARTYGSKQVIPGAATLFFVNKDGWAVTCKHVVDMLLAADKLNKKYNEFKTERNKLTRGGRYQQLLKGLELKYGLNKQQLAQLKCTFMDSVDKITTFTCHTHPKYDLALIKLNGFEKVLYKAHAVFKKDTDKVLQGQFMCRLGFPFPEFRNFEYVEEQDDIRWNSEGNRVSPRFPLEGMVTRFIGDGGKPYGIELSTPGLRGQSGGPLFDSEGYVCGMQYSTRHLHLGFDQVDKQILVNNVPQKVSDYAFIHLGQCVHAAVIKEFLREKNVPFFEE